MILETPVMRSKAGGEESLFCHLPFGTANHKTKEYNSQISTEWLYPHVLLPAIVNSMCPSRRLLPGEAKGSAAASMYFLKWWIIFCQVKNCILRKDKSKNVILCTSVPLPPFLSAPLHLHIAEALLCIQDFVSNEVMQTLGSVQQSNELNSFWSPFLPYYWWFCCCD